MVNKGDFSSAIEDPKFIKCRIPNPGVAGSNPAGITISSLLVPQTCPCSRFMDIEARHALRKMPVTIQFRRLSIAIARTAPTSLVGSPMAGMREACTRQKKHSRDNQRRLCMSDGRGGRGRPSPVPTHRLARLAGLGALTTGIATRTILEGARRLSRGELPKPSDLLLTPGNILRVSDELSRMRGAALKLGQLLSMDAGDFLPGELAGLLERLRADADFMPPRQLNSVLVSNWGPDWRKRFSRFETRPLAAASIGQVHRATTVDGRDLAIKVQYPGVAKSIDSDIANVISLFRLSGIAPPAPVLARLGAEARKQLHEEADYLREADNIRR